MTELKTLKDIKRTPGEKEFGVIEIDKLKAEAIKWIKEDLENIGNGEINHPIRLLFRWQKRLNITEEDLK